MRASSFSHTYCVSGPGSLREKLIAVARRGIFQRLSRCVPLNGIDKVLDVGVTADRECAYSNYFEQMFPHPERITAFSNQDASWMCDLWKGLDFVRGDACNMPFADNQFDLVFSSAVLEHVGSRDRQFRFVSECCRVSRKYVFITTPDRHFPVEMHSGLPFLHWLPDKAFRKVLVWFGHDELAQEANLNLLTCSDVHGLCRHVCCSRYELDRFWFFGFPSNILLTIEKS